MEEKLKAINDTKIEEAIAEAFSKLLEHECKCKIASRSYPKQEKAIFKIEITQIGYEDIILKIKGKEGEGKIEL
jgi:hypothetical protein